MHLIKRCVLGVFVSVFGAFFLVAIAPAPVSAQYYYDGYNNYYSYPDCGGYGSGYWYNCPARGSLTVYVQVINRYGEYRSPSDFTFYVSGASPSQQYFTGSSGGTTIYLRGSYSVSVYNQVGYDPTYSSGCTGSLAANETRVCHVTLTSSYVPEYLYRRPPYPYIHPYQPPVYQQPVTYVASYVVPTLPNTGFEPMSKTAIAFSLALVITLGVLFFPYVRKSFASLLR